MKIHMVRKIVGVMFYVSLAYQANCQNNLTNSNAKIESYVERHEVKPPTNQPAIYGVISLAGQICSVGVRGGHTNVFGFRPIPSQAFDAHLFSADGKEISKSNEGNQFGQPLEIDEEFQEFLDGKGAGMIHEMYDDTRRGMDFAAGAGNDHYWIFNVLKSFQIKDSGEYKLQVQVRLFIKGTNGVFQPLMLPPVETKVHISENNFGE